MKFQPGGFPRAVGGGGAELWIAEELAIEWPFCNPHHLCHWLMRSRAKLLTVGFLPGPLFWSLHQDDLSWFLPVVVWQKSSCLLVSLLWVEEHLQADTPFCLRDTDMFISTNMFRVWVRWILSPSSTKKQRNCVDSTGFMHPCLWKMNNY